ncbi:MAG TPA: phage baseplate assembly protein V, partial [Candidatus Limnocylindrales bacterium]|nr:phage baseplate assembly protein V [Candidatus Limnocylindrales bacterium]
GGTLHLVTLAGIGEPIPLSWGTTLLEARIEANGEPATRSVEASGWNAGTAETTKATASEPRVGRGANDAVAPGRIGGSGVRMLVDEAVPDADRAAALAQAELDARVGGELTLRAVTLGDPRLRPAAPIEVDNVAPSLAGRYVITEAVHTFGRDEGYLTEISTAPPPVPERTYETVAVPGVVTSVDDPDSLGRVRVTLPTYADIESAWMEVLSTGAGSGKGLVALPDVDDRVLVLLLHADPAHGVVLGGLYGAEGPPDSGVVGGSVKRYSLTTSGGQRIQLDDENGNLVLEDASGGSVTMGNQKIKFEDPSGSTLEMSPEKVRLHSAAMLEIEAPGNNVVIRASKIDFQTG